MAYDTEADIREAVRETLESVGIPQLDHVMDTLCEGLEGLELGEYTRGLVRCADTFLQHLSDALAAASSAEPAAGADQQVKTLRQTVEGLLGQLYPGTARTGGGGPSPSPQCGQGQ